MAKALRNYDEREVEQVVARRVAQGNQQGAVKGLGYWAARDYRAKKDKGEKGKS